MHMLRGLFFFFFVLDYSIFFEDKTIRLIFIECEDLLDLVLALQVTQV